MGTGGTTASANSVITESHPENRVWVVQSPAWVIQLSHTARITGCIIAHQQYNRQDFQKSDSARRGYQKLAKRSPEACRRRSGDCHDDAREFARRRPRLAGRLSRVAEKLVGSWLLLSAAPLAPVVALPIRGFFECV
ncbi:hypothetical protein GW17_00028950 [Ensete ventricosum]|nr:hypothetical protein GW17_00028950 [Ensete ventricosum]